MKNKVLKLCKRLNKTSLKEVLPILCATEAEIQPIFDELEAEGLIKKREDKTYFYVEPESNKPKLPLFFEYRTPEELDLIIRCFCTGLPTTSSCFLLNRSCSFIQRFNSCFRQLIYDKQHKRLQELYQNNPQQVRMRNFFDVHVYFYFYENQLYVSKEKLNGCKNEKSFKKNEILEFKRLYSYLTRKINHNKMQNTPYLYIAEELWRIDKDFSCMRDSIYYLLNNN